MTYDEKTPKVNDLPTPEQTKQFEGAVRTLLNPNGDNPTMDQYITSTFNYITNMFDKMQNASDSDAAAKEIAEDLKEKFENWAKSQKLMQNEEKEVK